MGFFDYLNVEVPIEGILHTETFQTKTFDDRFMNYYFIRDNKLWVQKKDLFDNDIDGVILLYVDNEGDEFNGDIRFYSSTPIQGSDNKKTWKEFKARFVEGNLHWIKTIEERVYEV